MSDLGEEIENAIQLLKDLGYGVYEPEEHRDVLARMDAIEAIAETFKDLDDGY